MKKTMDKIIDLLIRYIIALVITICFWWIGFIEENIFMYAFIIAIGGIVANCVISFFSGGEGKHKK